MLQIYGRFSVLPKTLRTLYGKFITFHQVYEYLVSYSPQKHLNLHRNKSTYVSMEQLKKIFCRYDMVCESPSGIGLEVSHMPDFFTDKPAVETSHMHVHGFYEIVWFEEGEGVHYVDFNEYPVTPGTVFFISPGQIHSFDQRHDQKGVVLKICSDMINDGSCNDCVYLRYNVFNAFDQHPYTKVSVKDVPIISHLIKAIEDELNETDSIGHKEYLQSLIKLFLIRVQRNGINNECTMLNPVRTSHKGFLSFRQLLEENYQRLHTVKDYALLLNVTTKTLNQYVNECSSYTPLELINNRITLEAKRLLKYSNMTIKEIAFRLGFDDPSYFVKFFKRQAKSSPADYREMV